MSQKVCSMEHGPPIMVMTGERHAMIIKLVNNSFKDIITSCTKFLNIYNYKETGHSFRILIQVLSHVVGANPRNTP